MLEKIVQQISEGIYKVNRRGFLVSNHLPIPMTTGIREMIDDKEENYTTQGVVIHALGLNYHERLIQLQSKLYGVEGMAMMGISSI